MRCTRCHDDLVHCHGTLVMHADGIVECDELHTCGGDEALHDWWVPCAELGCGCAGDEHDLPVVLARAA